MADLVHVKGLADLQKFLDELPAKLEKNVLRGALGAGAKVTLPAAKAGVHSVSGRLVSSLKVRTGSAGGVVRAQVYTKDPVAPLVEHGTAPHSITAKDRKAISFGGAFFQSVDHPGARPKPFMRPALDTTAADAVVAVAEYTKQRLATKEGLNTADVQIEAEEP